VTNILIVAGEHLRPHIANHLPDLAPDQLLCEPQAKGTAPALAWAAREIIRRSPRPNDTVMISLHSDHVIRPLDLFASTLEQAVEGAGTLDRLLTVGVTPSRPETGYGYIEVGASLTPGVFEVKRFVEKPDRVTAQDYIATGDFVWNSGMFVWRPQVLLAGLAGHTPELASDLPRLETEDVPGFFAAVPSLTIDHGLMERSDNIAVVKSDFDWDDVGAWDSLMRVRELDDTGNLLVGDAHAKDCQNSLLFGEDGPVVAYGVSDMVVVRASGITFIMPADRAADLKALLEELPEDLKKGVD
jgi:mannose-1-phosphate guanylyltransferase/mannose-6-phosphate isomerase